MLKVLCSLKGEGLASITFVGTIGGVLWLSTCGWKLPANGLSTTVLSLEHVSLKLLMLHVTILSKLSTSTLLGKQFKSSRKTSN